MHRPFEYRHRVQPEEIDSLGHANNVAYVEWMQQAAIAHSATLGWPSQRYRELGCGWVVRSHAITYLQPAWAEDELVVQTWVETMRRATSVRRYEIVRIEDNVRVATAQTLWAFIDYATGELRRIPEPIREAFPLWDGPPGAGETGSGRFEEQA